MRIFAKCAIIHLMRKCSVLILSLVCGGGAVANPYFGAGNNHQFAFNFGYGVNSGIIVPPPTQFVPFIMGHLQYSQPTTFFKLQARQSLNVYQTLGFGKKYGWNWEKFTIPIAVLSGDVAVLRGRNWYVGPGIGVGMQAQQNDRIGSKLVFLLKITAGYRITDHIGTEVFVQHFSNGNTDEDNHSYAFYGAGLTYSF